MWTKVFYQPLLNLTIFLYHLLGHNMGLAIIALTVLVRVALIPSTLKSLKAQKKLRALQDEIERIKKNHEKNKKKMTEKMMELYQAHGVNPLSSCLPMLVQIPILIALYQVFFHLSLGQDGGMLYSFVPPPTPIQTKFLWLDLGKPDPWYLLPLLTGLLQFWQSQMISSPSWSKMGVQEKQKKEALEFQKMFSQQMKYLFPLMSVFIVLKLPAAIALYWIVSTLFAIIHQYLVLGSPSKLTEGIVVKIKKRGT